MICVERIEEGWITLESDEGLQVMLPAHWLPGCREGDVLNVKVTVEGGAIGLRFEPDPEGRRAREDRLLALRQGLRRQAGNIKL